MAARKKATKRKVATKKKPTRKKASSRKKDPIFTLPKYKVEAVYITVSETIDWGQKMFNLPEIWRKHQGAGIKVAVLDTGIDPDHPDLKKNITATQDFTGSRFGIYDSNGHGTHVAGTIAAIDNDRGVVGVAPQAKLIIGKVLGDDGSGQPGWIANGIRWARQQGADLISMSLGAASPARPIYDAIMEVIADGCFVICAAGNDGPSMGTVGYPGGYKETIAVGAIDRRKRVARFSSRGDQVDVVAPGDQILSTWPGREYARLSGTSMATPFVSGVVALALAEYRKGGGDYDLESQSDLQQLLRSTAVDIGRKGFDPDSGFGLINPEGLIKHGVQPSDPRPETKRSLQVLLGDEVLLKKEI